MARRVLFSILWCIVLYFGACALVGGIAGAMASAHLQPGEDAAVVGGAAGAKAVEGHRFYIGLIAATLAIIGSFLGWLPGTRASVPKALASNLPRGIQRWTRTREMGRSRYIWVYGVLLWGITTGVLWSIVMAFFQGFERWPALLVGALLLFPVGGYFFGASMWKTMEAKYDQATAEQSGEYCKP